MRRDERVYFVDLPLAAGMKINNPELVILRICGQNIDVGSWCYQQRSTEKRIPRRPCPVVEATFSKARSEQLGRIFQPISDLISVAGKRPRTVFTALKKLKQFVDWSDSLGNFDCLRDVVSVRSSYRSWVDHINRRCTHHEISRQSAYQLQLGLGSFLEYLFDIQGLRGEMQLQQKVKSDVVGTSPISAASFAHVLAMNHSIFTGLCDLLLGSKQLPFCLSMPESLNWEKKHLWIFPTNRWRLPPHLWGAARDELSRQDWLYNYEEGRLSTLPELLGRYSKRSAARNRLQAQRMLKSAEDRLGVINADRRHKARIRLGMYALNAFVFLFFANTGINLSVARELETDGSLPLSSVNQKYRAIKYRSGGTTISVICSVAFAPELRRYMELRKFLLGEDSYPYLFFGLGTSALAKKPMMLQESILQSQYYVLRSIDPNIERITTRKIRATVQDYFLKNTDLASASKLMGHSTETAKKNYSRGSVSTYREEMTQFLEELAISAKRQKIITVGAVRGRVIEEGGACEGYGHPKSLSDDVVVDDCRSSCIFCANRVLMADESDVRKIASAAFVMESLIRNSSSETSFRPMLEKCDKDLIAISQMPGCKEMVERVKDEVYKDGKLTAYFSEKYQYYLMLELV